MSDNDLVTIYATACYIGGYVSTAHPDDEHLNEWADRLMQAIEMEMAETADTDIGRRDS